MATKKLKKVIFIQEVTVTDPDSHLPVEVSIYKDVDSGGLFGVDSSFLETEEPVYIPFEKGEEADIDGAEEDIINKYKINSKK